MGMGNHSSQASRHYIVLNTGVSEVEIWRDVEPIEKQNL